VGRSSIAISTLVLAIAAATSLASIADDSFRVIVNPRVKGTQIPKTALTQIFLKQAVKWGDGVAARPVDQSLRSPVRAAFCAQVIGQMVDGVQTYWTRRMVEGVTPPPVKPTDEDIIAFVASTQGAIGYVSSTTPLPDTVKVISIIE
jgi:ABC-type phosphate transport system substrate-binding protein